jgi:hypothetical protein
MLQRRVAAAGDNAAADDEEYLSRSCTSFYTFLLFIPFLYIYHLFLFTEDTINIRPQQLTNHDGSRNTSTTFTISTTTNIISTTEGPKLTFIYKADYGRHGRHTTHQRQHHHHHDRHSTTKTAAVTEKAVGARDATSQAPVCYSSFFNIRVSSSSRGSFIYDTMATSGRENELGRSK